MGKHKDKSKKSKKHNKKEKHSKRSRHDSSASDGSNSSGNEGEIVWTESGGATAESDLPPNQSESIASKPEQTVSNDSSGDEEVDKGNDWLGFIEKKSKGNFKLAHLKRDIRKKEQEKADNKVRYARELNSYYKDDVNKKFIDTPEEFWKNKSKAMETDSEDSDSSGKNDQEYDDDEKSEEPAVPKCKFCLLETIS